MGFLTRRNCVFVGVTAFLLFLGYITIERAALRAVPRTDITVYLAAGKAVWTGGTNLYEVTDEQGLHYIYPPVFAVLMAPLAPLPRAASTAIWYLVTLGLALIGLRATILIVTPEDQRGRPQILWAPLLICADPLLGTITRGQLGILMFACCAVALFWFRQGRPFASGLLVAFATVLKIYSGLLLFYFIVRKQWRAAAGFLTGAILFGLGVPSVAFGPALTVRHWMRWFTEVAVPFLRPEGPATSLFKELQNLEFAKNESLVATFTHFAGWLHFGSIGSHRIFATVLPGVIVCTLLIMLPMVWRARPADGFAQYRVIFEWSLALLAGLVVLPVSWSHYFCILVLPLTGITSYLHYQSNGNAFRLLRRCLIGTAILVGIFTLTSILRGPLGSSDWNGALMVVRASGEFCWASLLLAGTFSYILMTRSCQM